MRSSSKSTVLNAKDKISEFKARLKNLDTNSDNDDSSDEYNDDSCEDLNYRDNQSTNKLQQFVQSRALSKKIKKKLKKITSTVFKKKVLPFIGTLASKTMNTRSIMTSVPRQWQQSSRTTSGSNTVNVGGGNVFLTIPSGYIANTVSTTTTRLLTEQEAFQLGLLNAASVTGSETYTSYQNGAELNALRGNTVASSRSIVNNAFRVGNRGNINEYYQNTNSGLNINGIPDPRQINVNKRRFNKLTFSSVNRNRGVNYGNGAEFNALYGTTASGSRSISNNAFRVGNSGNTNEYYQNTNSQVNIDGIPDPKQINVKKRKFNKFTLSSVKRNHKVNYGNINAGDEGDDESNNYQNAGSRFNYRNIKTYGRFNQYAPNSVNGDANKNEVNKLYQKHVRTESKHIQKFGIKADGQTKSDGDKSNETELSEDSDDKNNGESKNQALHKRHVKSVYSRSVNVQKKTTRSISNNNDDGTESDKNDSTYNGNDKNDEDDKTYNKDEENDKIINKDNDTYTDEEENDKTNNKDGENNKSDSKESVEDNDTENNEDEDGEIDLSLDDEVSVYEYLDTYKEFRFDSGLNAVGIIGEVLNQLDYQRYKLMDDIQYPQDSTRYIVDGEEFDIIIAGGGNAGCVLANKLCENPNWKILLIEAGGDPLPITQVPGLWDRTLNSFTDWQYKLEPDSTTGFGINGNIKLHKGLCLGGSSTTGVQIYVRGSEKVYDSLVKRGLHDWSYNTTETYFKKMEKVRSVTKIETNTTIYGNCGLVPVSKFRKTEVTVLKKIVCSGFEKLGYKKERDINDKDIEEGFVSLQGTIKNGRSFNTAKSYLSPVFGRSNLKVMKYTRVMKVIVDETNMKATGVIIKTRFGQILTINARSEILLCAGAVGSAKILMASGIGPKKHLTEMEVPVVKDLPVGKEFLISPVFTGFVISYDKEIVFKQTDDEIAFKYLARHAGPLSTPKGMGFGGFLNTKVSGSAFADIEVHQFYIPKNTPSKLCQFKSMFGFSDNLLSMYNKLNSERAISIFTIALINPKSKGRVLLRSKNDMDNPIIVGNLLTDESDRKALLEAIKILSEIKESEEMKLADATLEGIDIDGCAKYDEKTDEHWKCLLKYMVSTTSSTAGSCRMGLETDQDAVVDSKLNVIGISNLRVVGRSVMPMITSAYSHVPCIMIAERASDMILSKYE